MPITDSKLLAFFTPTHDKEQCGLIIKHNRIIEVMNVHPDPTKGFEIPVEAVMKYEDVLEGTWHTHPYGSSALSEMDYACFLAWPDLDHYIISNEGVKRYVVKDGVVLNAD